MLADGARPKLPAQASPERFYGLSVDLGHPGLVDSQDSSDLFHRELFVIVEREDEPLSRRKLLDGAGEKSLDLAALQKLMRIGRAGIEGARDDAVEALRPEGGHLGSPHSRLGRSELGERQLHHRGELLVRRFPTELRFEKALGALKLSPLSTQGAGDPVEASQAVENGAPYAELGVGSKQDPFGMVEFLGGIQKPEDTRLGEVRHLDGVWKPRADGAGDSRDERKGFLDEAVSIHGVRKCKRPARGKSLIEKPFRFWREGKPPPARRARGLNL